MLRKSAREIAVAVKSNSVDPIEVTDLFIARIMKKNPTLNALVHFDPQIARNEALGVRRRMLAGEAMPLAGVPVTVTLRDGAGGVAVSAMTGISVT